MVTFRVYGRLIEALHSGATLQFDLGQSNLTLWELIEKVFGGKERLMKEIAFILINGRNCIFADGMDAKISNGDIIEVFPLIIGG